MLRKDRNFRKYVGKVLRQQFSTSIIFLHQLEQDLEILEKWEEKEKRKEIDEIELKDFLDIMMRKTLGFYDGIKALSVIANYNMEGYDEACNEDKKEKILS